MSNRGIEFNSTVMAIRTIEDCIRAAKKYTEGVRTIRQQHPIQGGEFVSRRFSKYYEVYPEMVVTWDMPASDAIDLLWGTLGTPCIDVLFQYDYRVDQASMTVKGGIAELNSLLAGIPDLCRAIFAEMVRNGQREAVREAIKSAALAEAKAQRTKEHTEQPTILDKVTRLFALGGKKQ